MQGIDTGVTRRGGQTFPRSKRILDAKAFAQAFAARRRFSCGSFQVYARANGGATPRLGMAINRKACGTAVRRNRLKRLTRETFRRLSARLGGVDLVVSISRSMSTAALRTYARDLHSLFEKAGQCASPSGF